MDPAAKGLQGSVREVVDRCLGVDQPAYVKLDKPDTKQSLGFIHRGGGLAVPAHPIGLELEGDDLGGLEYQLEEYGLDGLDGPEAYYPL